LHVEISAIKEINLISGSDKLVMAVGSIIQERIVCSLRKLKMEKWKWKMENWKWGEEWAVMLYVGSSLKLNAYSLCLQADGSKLVARIICIFRELKIENGAKNGKDIYNLTFGL